MFAIFTIYFPLHKTYEAESDGELLFLEEVHVENVIENTSELLCKAELCTYINKEDYEDLYSKSWVKRQRKELKKRLGINTFSADTKTAMKFSNLDELLNSEDIENCKRIPPEGEITIASFDEVVLDSSENWLSRVIRFLTVNLMSKSWEIRHGSAIGLIAIVNGLFPVVMQTITVSIQESSVHCNFNTENHSRQNTFLPYFLLEDIVATGFCVIILDHFIDFSDSDVAVFPVKESIAQLVACASRFPVSCDQKKGKSNESIFAESALNT